MTNIIAVLASVITTVVSETNWTDNAEYERVKNPCTCPAFQPREGIFAVPAINHDHGWSNGRRIKEPTERIEKVTETEHKWVECEVEGVKVKQQVSMAIRHTKARVHKLDAKWVAEGWAVVPQITNNTARFNTIPLDATNATYTNFLILTNLQHAWTFR